MSQRSVGAANSGYQQPRPGWWRANQERLNACYNKYLEDKEKEAKRKEEEEKQRLRKEEEDRKLEWKREREQPELEMGARLDKRLELLGLSKKATETRDGCSKSGEDELTRLKRENDELKKKLGGEVSRIEDDKVLRLQREIAELRRQVTSRQTDNDEIYALKKVIEELRSSAYVKTNFESEIACLRSEINLLRDMTSCAEEEALDQVISVGMWRSLLRNALTEVTLSHGGPTTLKAVQERLSKLTASDDADEPTTGGTNLKEELEAAALRSARKGKKATPGREAAKAVDKGKSHTVNDRHAFVENLKKQLRTLKKSGLEPYCKEAGIKLGRVEETIDAIAEYRANQAFPKKEKRQEDGEDRSVQNMDDDDEQTAAGTSEYVDEQSCVENKVSTVGIACASGDRLGENWKLLKRKFGSSLVHFGDCVLPLRKSRGLFLSGNFLLFSAIVPFMSRSLVLKPSLAGLLSDPSSRTDLWNWDFPVLVRAFSAIRSFSEKRSRYRLRLILSGVIRRRFDVNVRRRLIIRITYDEVLCKSGIRAFCADWVMRAEADEEWKRMTVRRMRVVWVKKRSVGTLLFNFRKYAQEGVCECTCSSLLHLPRVDGHVVFRMNEWDDAPGWMRSNKNIARPMRNDVVSRLKSEISASFLETGFGLSPIRRNDLKGCVKSMGADSKDWCTEEEVNVWKEKMCGLVRTPIDHNAGDTVLCCPIKYREGMDNLFLNNPGFVIREEEEDALNEVSRRTYEEMGLEGFAKWDKQGKLGRAYVIPKHKDVSRWRPICPSFSECGVRASRKISMAINLLIWELPKRSNFNLNCTDLLVDSLDRINKDLKKGEALLTAVSDVKEMFCNLPHDSIVNALDWLIDFWLLKGVGGVLVKRRGKGAKLLRGKREEGCQLVEFNTIRDSSCFDLEHTFLSACGRRLQQLTGIPMGNPTSPAVACMLCIFSEFSFLSSLGID
ncbi:hypothetical protein CBR_g12509 [Chara braunii]|uniref:Reverse transcriptase domain-containing protein n=1 Tax=Chara braunii TaxID=69332 RepID=A0A388JSK1_CHABU|nr:hypothetical protein CBR_g12509 [Chara braunii]|eukprot:GBG60771.1 hypothetical protein CBR_g12509 [Chara braunii]